MDNQKEIGPDLTHTKTNSKHEVSRKLDVQNLNTKTNAANSIANETLRWSNVVEGNDIFLPDVLNSSHQPMFNSDSCSSGNVTFESSTTHQAANVSHEPTLSFELDNDGFITPCLINSLQRDFTKSKHRQLG